MRLFPTLGELNPLDRGGPHLRVYIPTFDQGGRGLNKGFKLKNTRFLLDIFKVASASTTSGEDELPNEPRDVAAGVKSPVGGSGAGAGFGLGLALTGLTDSPEACSAIAHEF